MKRHVTGSPKPYRVLVNRACRGMNESDYSVTGALARAVLAAAKARGLDGYSRVNRAAFTRQESHDQMLHWISETADDHFVWPVFAFRIRQEFGVDGSKRGVKTRTWPKRRVERWPKEAQPE